MNVFLYCIKRERSAGRCRRHLAQRCAFTLVELLVAITIVVVLAGLLLVAMRGIGGSASLTASQATLRQMMAAYSLYAQENKARLVPGFQVIDDPVNQAAKLPNGELLDACVGTVLCDSASWMWHLAPFVDDGWQTFYKDYDRAKNEDAEASYDAGYYGPGTTGSLAWAVPLSMRPSYGLNSIFLGGDDFHAVGVADKPAPARGMSDVKVPSQVIAFAPAATASSGPVVSLFDAVEPSDCEPATFDTSQGYAELRPPFVSRDQNGVWGDEQWKMGKEGQVRGTGVDTYVTDFDGTQVYGAGLLVDRHGGPGVVPVGHVDGSTDQTPISSLWRDMSRWSPIEYRNENYIPETVESSICP